MEETNKYIGVEDGQAHEIKYTFPQGVAALTKCGFKIDSDRLKQGDLDDFEGRCTICRDYDQHTPQ